MISRNELVLAGSGALLCASFGAQAQAQTNTFHDLRIAHHADTNNIPSDTNVTSAFTAANDAIHEDSGANDVVCGAVLSLKDRTWFSGGGTAEDIDTQSQYEAVQNHVWGGYGNFVSSIGWCGTSGNFGGCGWPIGGDKPFLLEDVTGSAAARGIVYAHEFGHTVGLSHDETGSQIMDGDLLLTSYTKILTDAKCDKFEFGPEQCNNKVCSHDGEGLLLSMSGVETTAAETTVEEPMREPGDFSTVPIEELAMGYILDTIPVAVEDYYGEEDVDILIQMLGVPDMSPHHGTIATLIGLISDGREESVAALEDHFMNLSDRRERRGVGIALGYITARTGKQRPVDFLLAAAATGASPESVTAGLGLSGHPLAEAWLASRQVTASGVRAEVLAQAIADNAEVRGGGLRAYYNVK